MNEKKIPKHVAIIPDGNRRWAKKKGLKAALGHAKGASKENITSLLNEAASLGVKYFSIWVFSTENWNRDEKERNAIFELVLGMIGKIKKEVHENKIRFRHVGRKDRLPSELIRALDGLEKDSEGYEDFSVNLCLDYGGRLFS